MTRDFFSRIICFFLGHKSWQWQNEPRFIICSRCRARFPVKLR